MTVDIPAIERFLQTAPRDLALYKACRDYASHFDGENDLDAYTNGEYRVLATLLPDCVVAFDVGANRGDWAETALALNPALQIHAFEPGAASFAALTGRGLPAAVRCNRLGLGAAAEQRELYALGTDTRLASLYRRTGLEDDYKIETPARGELVTITTLDAYCAEAGVAAIDYLKIDTEGHDLQVLRGGRGLVERGAVRFIQFEYGASNVESRDLLKDFFAFFAGTRYNLHKIHAEGFGHYPRYNVRLENFQYQNWLVVRQE
ncbi:MAG: FkbM family methyltransferase [Alphaproteobacteria bacterium]|nr:FkbM family methyltransferase [Alphaproteobacteria bacterium]